MPDEPLIEHFDDFLFDLRARLREGLEHRVVSPFARETIKRALESGSKDREHDALVLVAEELGGWTATKDPKTRQPRRRS